MLNHVYNGGGIERKLSFKPAVYTERFKPISVILNIVPVLTLSFIEFPLLNCTVLVSKWEERCYI